MSSSPLLTRIAELSRQSGRRVEERAPTTDDWSGRIDAQRLALRARERAQRDAAAALPGEEVAPGVRRVRHLERDVPAPSRDWPWDRDAAAAGPLLLLDTETTGLSGGTGTLVFLLGLARWHGADLLVDQWLLTAPSAEHAWLDAIAAEVPDDAVLVSFNGRAFDLPLLATRYRLNRRADPFAARVHQDLLAPLRRAFASRWSDCRLMTAERRLLGIERVDDLPGAFAPVAYQAFLRGQDLDGLRGVIAHNRRDVIALAHLLPALARVFDEPGAFDADVAGIAARLRAVGRAAAAETILRRHVADPQVRRALAFVLKRERRWDEAERELSSLCDGPQPCIASIEALAKIAEHVRRDFERALCLALELDRLESGVDRHRRRIARLQARVASAPAMRSPAAAGYGGT